MNQSIIMMTHMHTLKEKIYQVRLVNSKSKSLISSSQQYNIEHQKECSAGNFVLQFDAIITKEVQDRIRIHMLNSCILFLAPCTNLTKSMQYVYFRTGHGTWWIICIKCMNWSASYIMACGEYHNDYRKISTNYI